MLLLKDAVLKADLGELEREIAAFMDRSLPPVDSAPTWCAHHGEALALVQKAIAKLDEEMARLTELRLAAGDANMLKQKVLGDPRRQAENLVSAVKQKLGAERSEWSRRVAKQAQDVGDGLDANIQAIAVTTRREAGQFVIAFERDALKTFDAWHESAYATWIGHLSQLLPSRTSTLLQPEIKLLEELLGVPSRSKLPSPPPLAIPSGKQEDAPAEERADAPTAAEIFFETFKGGLNTVAMLSGLLIIPVVGSLMQAASTQVKALIMTVTVLPVAALSVLTAKKQKRKLGGALVDKARQKLIKDKHTAAKIRLERFKADAERYTHAYLGQAQLVVVGDLEVAIGSAFAQKERSLVTELAKAQMEADRIVEQLNVLKQVKSGLSNTLVVDLKRKIRELGGKVADTSSS